MLLSCVCVCEFVCGCTQSMQHTQNPTIFDSIASTSGCSSERSCFLLFVDKWQRFVCECRARSLANKPRANEQMNETQNNNISNERDNLNIFIIIFLEFFGSFPLCVVQTCVVFNYPQKRLCAFLQCSLEEFESRRWQSKHTHTHTPIKTNHLINAKQNTILFSVVKIFAR